MAAVIVSSVTASNYDCVDIGCLKENLRRICQSDPKYLDCENILRCMGAGEQEIMRCAKGYLAN